MIRRATYENRLRGTQEALRQAGLDGLLVIKPENVRYVSGLCGYHRRPEYALPRRLIAVVIATTGEPCLIVPKLEHKLALELSWIQDLRYHVEWPEEGSTRGGLKLLESVLLEKGLSRGLIGIEKTFVSIELYELLKKQFPQVRFVDGGFVLGKQRMIKCEEEIEILRQSGRMAVRELEVIQGFLKPGIKEYELFLRSSEAATKANAEALPVDSPYCPVVEGVHHVISGPRLSLVHGLPTVRTITEDDFVMLDFCWMPQRMGYRVGFARMVGLRQPSAREREIYNIALEAQRNALECVKPGARACEVDNAARKVITQAGYGSYILHRSGKSVGIELVEKPELSEDDQTVLEPGMAIAVEPGIYIPGVFTARVEDTVLVTQNGHKTLTDYSKELRVV